MNRRPERKTEAVKKEAGEKVTQSKILIILFRTLTFLLLIATIKYTSTEIYPYVNHTPLAIFMFIFIFAFIISTLPVLSVLMSDTIYYATYKHFSKVKNILAKFLIWIYDKCTIYLFTFIATILIAILGFAFQTTLFYFVKVILYIIAPIQNFPA